MISYIIKNRRLGVLVASYKFYSYLKRGEEMQGEYKEKRFRVCWQIIIAS